MKRHIALTVLVTMVYQQSVFAQESKNIVLADASKIVDVNGSLRIVTPPPAAVILPSKGKAVDSTGVKPGPQNPNSPNKGGGTAPPMPGIVPTNPNDVSSAPVGAATQNPEAAQPQPQSAGEIMMPPNFGGFIQPNAQMMEAPPASQPMQGPPPNSAPNNGAEQQKSSNIQPLTPTSPY